MHMIFCDKLVCALKRRGYSDITLDAGVPNWARLEKGLVPGPDALALNVLELGPSLKTFQPHVNITVSESVNTKVSLSRWKHLCAKKGNLAKKVAAARNLTHQQITLLELSTQAMIRKTSGKLPNIYRSRAEDRNVEQNAGPTTTVSCLNVAGNH